jgi:Tfp pilus assembly protein PilZ
MGLSEKKFRKYNVFMARLINRILALNPEEQRFLLKNIEKFSFNEKRTTARKVCRIAVRYFHHDHIYKDFIINIGLAGCFIETKKPLMIGEIILMDINLEKYDKSIRIKGEVVNADRLGMGIEFKDVSSYLSERLRYILFKIL